MTTSSLPRTKADLCGLNVMAESEYGRPPAGTATHAGTLLTWKSPDAHTSQDIMKCGSRLSGGQFLVGSTTKYSAQFNIVRNKGLARHWLTQALGGDTVQTEIPSHTAVINVTSSRQGTAREIHYYQGSMVDSLTISASELGGPLELNVEAVCRWHAISDNVTAPQYPDGTDASIISPVPVPVEVPVTNSKPITWARGAVTGTEYVPQWTLSIGNSLQAVPSIGGTEDAPFRLENGEKSIPQASTVEFSFTFPSRDATWDRMRLEYVNDLTFEFDVDGTHIKLENCTLDSAMPDRKSESGYDETVSVTVGKITLTDSQQAPPEEP